MKTIREDQYKWIWAAVFIILAVLSFTLFHDYYLNNPFTRYAINYLDEKANTVLGLTGASTSASVAITMIPGDIGTPIASELANISSYAIIVLAAVHLEKYLITLAAFLALRILLPAALIIAAVNIVAIDHPALKSLVKRVCTFSIAVILVIPASVYLSTLVENTYKDDVQLSIEETQKEAEEIKENLVTEDASLWDKFINSVSGGTVELVTNFENSLNNFVEAISVMLITAVVLPLLTFAVLIWLVKSILQIDLRTPSLPQLANRTKIDPRRIMGKDNGIKQIE